MFNENKTNKAEDFFGGTEHKDCKKNKMLNNNVSYLCSKYIHAIRNMNSLNKEMIDNIYNMSN